MKDILGAICSGVCLLHCLMLPLFMATGASAIGLAYLADESTHLLLSAAMVLLALLSFPAGWRQHQKLLPSTLALVGLIAMLVALSVGDSLEAYLTAVAGLALICGHLLNRRWIAQRAKQTISQK